MVSLEFRNNKREPETYYSLDPLKLIHDYNTGVSYGINMRLGNCTIGPITNQTFDEDSNYTSTVSQSENSFIIRLKSAASLLLLDRDYIYSGERTTEFMNVESFVSSVLNDDKQSYTVVDYSFTKVSRILFVS